MRTLIDVERNIWGKVKNFATINGLSLSLAVQQLLQQGLADSGYYLKEGDARNEG